MHADKGRKVASVAKKLYAGGERKQNASIWVSIGLFLLLFSAAFFLISLSIKMFLCPCCCVDYSVYIALTSNGVVDVDNTIPSPVQPP